MKNKHIILVLSCLVSICFLGCKNTSTCKLDDMITCYYPDYYEPGKIFELKKCPDDPPPCDCKDINGNNITDLFNSECQSCMVTTAPECGGIIISVTNSYIISDGCAIPNTNTVCTEFDPVYFDFGSSGNNDQNFRPVYVQFGIDEFDLTAFTYKFVIKNSNNQEIDSKILDNAVPTYLRYIDPSSCGTTPCYTTGTINMDIHTVYSAGFAGQYQVIMYKIDKSNQAETELDDDFFTLEDDDNNYSTRLLGIDLFTTNNLNLGNYNIDKRTFYDAMEYVFGSTKSNMDFTISTQSTPSDLVDSDGDIMLNAEDLPSDGSTFEEIKAALDLWVQKLYKINQPGPTFNNTAVAIEVNFMKSYNFDVTPPAISSFNSEFVTNAEIHLNRLMGITLPVEPNGNYTTHLGCIVIKQEVKNVIINVITSSQITEDGLALQTFLHEAGHLWSSLAFDFSGFDDCQRHTNKGGALNSGACLWQTACINPSNLNDFLLSVIQNPVYCEKHQQIFMNQLRIK